MKLRGAKQIHYDSGPNMTPLVDVVMVILIFLMLAGSFGGSSSFLLSKQGIKSKGGAHRPLKPGEVPDTPIDIYVDNLKDGSGFIAHMTGIEPTTKAADITSALASKRAQFLATGTKPDQLQVVLHPRVDTKWRYLIAVYQAANQAQFEKIAFATSQ
jgi:biopolymer transport protein ExbD